MYILLVDSIAKWRNYKVFFINEKKRQAIKLDAFFERPQRGSNPCRSLERAVS